ncbi:hypothetical protein BD410DRAFT_784186 [Rickenella mellea]|uniref:Flavin reductase like domain-containing protein n=1 Tax=Rickenella mellea TaxID=50990 RepID=A0A4Y7QET7_9AGAM|nr:hypothetical protein BD410DRAFT_784186 [Rickenella mellea]
MKFATRALLEGRGAVSRTRQIGSSPQNWKFYSSTPSESRPPFNAAPSFNLTRSPNPQWKAGEGLPEVGVGARQWKEDEQQGWSTWNVDEMESRDIYKVLTSAITPRPIAFISSLSASGVPNLAPFSYFSMVSHNPPMVSVSFALSPKRPKDTRENIEATREFVVNIISEPFAEAANVCSVEAPASVDEWTISGLTREPSVTVRPPRVKESAVSLECELFQMFDIKPKNSETTTASVALGYIKTIHIRNAVLTQDGVVDPGKLRAISRLGGTMYARVGEGFEIPRPSWRAMKDEAERMSGN